MQTKYRWFGFLALIMSITKQHWLRHTSDRPIHSPAEFRASLLWWLNILRKKWSQRISDKTLRIRSWAKTTTRLHIRYNLSHTTNIQTHTPHIQPHTKILTGTQCSCCCPVIHPSQSNTIQTIPQIHWVHCSLHLKLLLVESTLRHTSQITTLCCAEVCSVPLMTKALWIGPKQTHILSNFSYCGKYDKAAVYLIMLRI